MARELARAKESVTSPRPSKVPSGDGEERRSWANPEVSHDHQGVLVRLKDQGLQHTIASRRVVSATANAVVTQRGSCEIRRPRGLNGRLGN
jgi:hypothetical protein